MLGSAVNLPVARLAAEVIHTARVVTVFGMRYLLPEVQERPAMLMAVNLGGAVVPASLAIYLIWSWPDSVDHPGPADPGLARNVTLGSERPRSGGWPGIGRSRYPHRATAASSASSGGCSPYQG
jgi:hypothetical protein